jgi:hypothetical protein
LEMASLSRALLFEELSSREISNAKLFLKR